MLPVLTAPIAVPSVARIGEPDIPEAIHAVLMHGEQAALMRDRTVQPFARERHHARRRRPLPLTRRRGAVPRGQSLRATPWGRRNGEGLDGVDHPLIGFVLLAQVLTVRRSEQRNVGDRVDE